MSAAGSGAQPAPPPGLGARAPGWLQPIIPQGLLLTEEVWRSRHRFILLLLAAHVPAILVFGLWRSFDPLHVALEAGIPAVLAMAALFYKDNRKVSSTLASFGLLSCSAILVHLSGGYIEMHFHFFVMLPIISLYHDWTPFLLAIGYVAVHHGVMGSIDPTSVYNHPDAIAHPWRWAMIHAFFILGICAASVYNWRLTEAAMDRQVASERESARFATALLRTTSHELNTPLTPLSLHLEMLRSEHLGPLTERQRNSLGVIDRNFQRLTRLVRDVMEAMRLRDGRLAVVREPLDLREVVQEAAEVFGEPAKQRRIALDVRIPEALPVEGDPRRLHQVFVNILGNAFKFTPDGGAVDVTAHARGGEAVVQVRDSGRGMAPEQVAKLFQPFQQLEPTDATLGMGLGLFISRGIVDQHGGRIGAASEGLGRGATFEVALPLRSKAAGEGVPSTARLPAQAAGRPEP
jgi:signal transduction histidine kinase